MKAKIVDDRPTPGSLPWLVVGTDTFMSGWGEAEGGYSYAGWACESLKVARHVAEQVKQRGDMRRVRIVCDRESPYRPRCAHLHISACEPGHRYHPETFHPEVTS